MINLNKSKLNHSSIRDLVSIVDDNEPSENKIDLGQDFDYSLNNISILHVFVEGNFSS